VTIIDTHELLLVLPDAPDRPAVMRTPDDDERDAHLLRVSLELQLDSLLLLLGGSAVTGAVSQDTPWRRWLGEDIDLTAGLAETALAVRATLPASLGGDPTCADPGELTEQLLARYTGVCALLADLLAPHGDGDGEGVLDESAAAPPDLAGHGEWLAQVRVALPRYEARVAELEARRTRSHDGEAAPAAAASVHPWVTAVRRPYVPGEWLG